jgi:hypothetical protein
MKTKISQHDLARARNRVRKWASDPDDTPNAQTGPFAAVRVRTEIEKKRYERAMALITYSKLGEDL